MVLGPPVRTVLFDFDGTLFHLPVDWAGLRRALGVADDVKLGPLLQAFLDSGDAERLAVVTSHEMDAVARGSFLPGAPECLRPQGVDVAIVTRNSRHPVLAALATLGLAEEDLLVVGREDVRRLKPDPDGVFAAMARLGASPRETALVGDTFHDVEAARAAGVRSAVVRNPRLAYQPAGAGVYLDDLRQALDRLGG